MMYLMMKALRPIPHFSADELADFEAEMDLAFSAVGDLPRI